MGEHGGVGIVFHASRSGRCLLVKSLVPGGAAEKSCAVEVGHQIIAIGDNDVSSSTLEEVAVFLRGSVGTEVQLKFLETRRIKLTMERCVYMNDGTPSVGIRWKDGSSEMVVEGMMPGYQGFGGTPKSGDRLLSIDGEDIEKMPDDEIWDKLAGSVDSSVRLEFARGVAHHSVSLMRQPLIVPTVSTSSAAAPDDSERDKTIEALPISFARDLVAEQQNCSPNSPTKTASPSPSSQDDYMAYQESPKLGALFASGGKGPPAADPVLSHAVIDSKPDTSYRPVAPISQPLQPFSPNKEINHQPLVIKTKMSSMSNAAYPKIGVNSRIEPKNPSQQLHLQRAAPPQSPSSTAAIADDDGYLPAPLQEEVSAAATGSGPQDDPTQLVLKKQLVDIAKRLRREVEEKDQEITSLKEAQGDPDALQKLVVKGQGEIAELRQQIKKAESKFAEAESNIKQRDSELATVKSVLMRRAEKSGDAKKQLEDMTATFVALGEEKKALALSHDKLQAELRACQDTVRQLQLSREMDQANFRDAAEMTVKWKMGEVEKQQTDLRSELKLKREECANTTTQLHSSQQLLATEQKTAHSNYSKLQEALAELNRLRDANSTLCNEAKEYKEHCAKLEHELVATGKRSADLMHTVDDCKNMLEEATKVHAERLKKTEAAWEDKCVSLKLELESKAEHHAAVLEDNHIKYALLQSEMEEARGLMEEARNKIMSLEDTTKQDAAQLSAANAKITEIDRQLQQAKIECNTKDETIEEMQASHLDEEGALKLQLASETERADELTEKFEAAEKTINMQSAAIAEERRCTDEWQAKASRLENDVKALEEDVRVMHTLKMDLDVATNRLRNLESLQSRVQAEAKHREDFRKQFRGPHGIPYQQLARMLEDATVSVSSMQGLVTSKDQEIKFYKSQLGELAHYRETSADTEKQVMKLRESLDFKTIAVQQTIATLSNCQEVMKRYNLPASEIDQVSVCLAANQKHATQHDGDVDTSRFNQSKPVHDEDVDAPRFNTSKLREKDTLTKKTAHSSRAGPPLQSQQSSPPLPSQQTPPPFSPALAPAAAPAPRAPTPLQRPGSSQGLYSSNNGESSRRNSSRDNSVLYDSSQGHVLYDARHITSPMVSSGSQQHVSTAGSQHHVKGAPPPIQTWAEPVNSAYSSHDGYGRGGKNQVYEAEAVL